jgi:rare lipoprotein A
MKVGKYMVVTLLCLMPALFGAQVKPKELEEFLTIQEGTASYYGKKFHLRKTSSGEIFRMEEMTAAHKNLPFGTMVQVTLHQNGKSVWVKVNDRLPQNSKRIIDLSRGAAEELGIITQGLAKVSLSVKDNDTIKQLRAHYGEKVPTGMRLRWEETEVAFARIPLPAPVMGICLKPFVLN